MDQADAQFSFVLQQVHSCCIYGELYLNGGHCCGRFFPLYGELYTQDLNGGHC